MWYQILFIDPYKVLGILKKLNNAGVTSDNIKITYAMDTEQHIFYFHSSEVKIKQYEKNKSKLGYIRWW